jgi:hypothetical protein
MRGIPATSRVAKMMRRIVLPGNENVPASPEVATAATVHHGNLSDHYRRPAGQVRPNRMSLMTMALEGIRVLTLAACARPILLDAPRRP